MAGVIFLMLVTGCGQSANPMPTALYFEESSDESGLTRTGKSFAAAGADFDRDGWPDLAVSTHGAVRLYRNLEGRSFKDVSKLGRFREGGDSHSIAWLDWNNDGWPDLHVSRGACRGRCLRADRIYLNREGEGFELAALPPAVANRRGSSRSVTPWDLNHDGLLDLMILNYLRRGRQQHLALSGAQGYRDVAMESGWHDLRATAVTTFRMGDETLFVLSGKGLDAGHVLERKAHGRFVKVTGDIGISLESEMVARAVAIGDVDNDGDLDLYFANAPSKGQGAVIHETGLAFSYRAWMTDESAGFRVATVGPFTLQVWPQGKFERLQLRLGSNALPMKETRLRVMTGDHRLNGEPDLSEAGAGIYFWRSGPGEYVLRYLPGPGKNEGLEGRLTTVKGQLRLLEQDGERKSEATNQLYINEGDHLRAVDAASDTRASIDAEFVDFDNDGDLDLYVVNGGKLQNQANRLYENRGNLQFVDVTDAAGVAGTKRGHAAGILSFDYDRDGRMDLFLTNGQGPPPRNKEGPYELFHNVSDAGNWLRVKLEATVSNPMALGARVIVKTEQGRQFRFVSAATGAFSTSWLPLHFGLGEANVATITVHWPSGRVQQQRTKANRSITLREPSQAAGRH